MENSVKDLSKYRFESSLEDLYDARIMFENARYKNTLNRAYYSIFHAIKAVCALDGFDSSKHSGLIAYFNQNYVKTNIFQKNCLKLFVMHLKTEKKLIILIFFLLRKKKQQNKLKELNISPK